MLRSGIRPQTDPRLAPTMNRLRTLTPPALSVKDLKLDPQTFKIVLIENLVMVKLFFLLYMCLL